MRSFEGHFDLASVASGTGLPPDPPCQTIEEMTVQLVRYDAAKKALAAASRVDEAKNIRDRAEAVRVYAQQARDYDLQNRAATIRLLAERRAGQLLGDMAKNPGTRGEGRPKKNGSKNRRSSGTTAYPPTLDDLGISRDQSSKWQRLARLFDDDTFELALSRAKEQFGELTTAGVMQLAKDILKPKGTVVGRDNAIKPDINILAAELTQEIESVIQKGRLNVILRQQSRLSPTISENLIHAFENAIGQFSAGMESLRLAARTVKPSGKADIHISRRSVDDEWPVDDPAKFKMLAFEHYREHGFPLYSMDAAQKGEELQRLLDYDHTSVLRNKQVSQSMHGLSLAWCYFPHAWEVECNNMKTPFEVFHDDALFMKAIAKRLKHGTYISDSGIRKALRSFTGTQGVSNFRPSAAASLYHRYLPEEGGVVWDMSSGFGGRLLGAMACDRVRRYIGTDPSTETITGLKAMKRELLPVLRKLMPKRPPLEVELHKCGSEDYKPKPESLELCCSSPPYANHERYSDEESQSYMRFPSSDEWMNGFMKQTLANCHVGLKPSGYLILNVAGVKSYPTLVFDLVFMAEANGWKLVDRLDLLLSKMMGTRGDGESFKKEPILVFQKLAYAAFMLRQEIANAKTKQELLLIAKRLQLRKVPSAVTLEALRQVLLNTIGDREVHTVPVCKCNHTKKQHVMDNETGQAYQCKLPSCDCKRFTSASR